MSKLRLSEGKKIEVHKVTKPESVEAGLIFRSADNLKALTFALVPCRFPQGACCEEKTQIRSKSLEGGQTQETGTKEGTSFQWASEKLPIGTKEEG